MTRYYAVLLYRIENGEPVERVRTFGIRPSRKDAYLLMQDSLGDCHPGRRYYVQENYPVGGWLLWNDDLSLLLRVMEVEPPGLPVHNNGAEVAPSPD